MSDKVFKESFMVWYHFCSFEADKPTCCMNFLFRFLFFFFITIVHAQELVLPPDYIKTIQLRSSGKANFAPIFPLNGSFELSFDDLEADEKDYYYKIEHCDRFWKTTDLITTEFVAGYAEEQLYEYENSFNTLQFYTHYRIQFPNANTRLLLSGNYRISILDEDENIIFTRYFTLYESLTTVGVSVHRSRDVAYINSQQSVQFSINHPGFLINNPTEEIHPVILQNNDYATAVTGLQPQFIRGDQLLYKYDAETAFWGGNEFLNFDTKEIRLSNMNVARVVSGKDLYHTYLYSDKIRAYDPYTYYPDADGAFVIRNATSNNAALEADYSWVHFTLQVAEPFDHKAVYVYGRFNNYQLTDENKMTYHPETHAYEVAILLKQGFYNYTYATLDDKNVMNLTEINGSFEETENEYSVLVYYSKFGSTYDRVIGYGKGNSKNLQQ